MPRHVTIFNIGTGHSRAEKYLLFNYLYHCLNAAPLDVDSWAGIASIGPTKATVTWGGTPDRVIRNIAEAMPPNDALSIQVRNDHWKMINDGPAAKADFMESKTVTTDPRKIASGSDVLPISEKVFRLLIPFHQQLPIDQINLVGHSRGCIVCMRIAALLHRHFEEVGGGGPDINILLIDPVERTLRGERDLNITVHENVQNFIQLVMENEHDDKTFGLSKIHGTALYPDSVILVPGRHGTLTQFNNQPIQELGYNLITYYLNLWEVPFRNVRIGTEMDIIKSFFKVALEHPIIKGGKDLRGKLFRKDICDQDGETFKTGYLKARLAKLADCGWENIRREYGLKYCHPDNIFATPSHYDFFMKKYPNFDPMNFETFDNQFREDVADPDLYGRIMEKLGPLAYRGPLRMLQDEEDEE